MSGRGGDEGTAKKKQLSNSGCYYLANVKQQIKLIKTRQI